MIFGFSFNFENRQFDGTGSTTVDMPKPGSFVQSDFEFYLPKRASLFLTAQGQFKIVEGVSAELPQLPKDIDSAFKILEISSSASDSEVKKAYRKMAVKYHPDKVAHLGKEIQKTAEEKFKAVSDAYNEIKKQRNIS